MLWKENGLFILDFVGKRSYKKNVTFGGDMITNLAGYLLVMKCTNGDA